MASRLGWLFFLIICIGTFQNWRRGVESPFDIYLRERGWTVPFWIISCLVLLSLFVCLAIEVRRLARAKAMLQALRARVAAEEARSYCPRHRHLVHHLDHSTGNP
jgi:hypothetical protein